MVSDGRIYTQHSRSFAENRFVYPVISRRSGGLSIGVNLNPDKVCNFDCIYCQVDRRSESETRFLQLPQFRAELEHMLSLAVSGQVFHSAPFNTTPVHLRQLRDMAFSGDGEPTTFRNLLEVFETSIAIKHQHNLPQLKMVLITNASMFHRPHVQQALELLDAHAGEIWAKLDAGTEAYYHLIERTTIPFARILANITQAAQKRAIVIQSMFMRVAGEGPSLDEQDAYCQRLQEILRAGGAIREVQVYTIARRPAESIVTPLDNGQIDALADRVRQVTNLPTSVYYGVEWQEQSEWEPRV